MRTKIAPIAVGLGVFLIVAAALVRFYAYPSLAEVPADYDGVTELEAVLFTHAHRDQCQGAAKAAALGIPLLGADSNRAAG